MSVHPNAVLQEGLRKPEYWKYTFEDALDLIARLPEAAALIYRRTFHDGKVAKHDKVRRCPSLSFL
jgi:hypothetical protein